MSNENLTVGGSVICQLCGKPYNCITQNHFCMAPAPQVSNEKAAPEIREWRKQWSHPPTPIPAGASGLWYSEDCVDQMLADYSNVRIAALQAEVDALKVQLAEMTEDRDLWKYDHEGDCPYQTENIVLKAEVARRSAPVTDAESGLLAKSSVSRVQEHAINALILARATPPQDVEPTKEPQ